MRRRQERLLSVIESYAHSALGTRVELYRSRISHGRLRLAPAKGGPNSSRVEMDSLGRDSGQTRHPRRTLLWNNSPPALDTFEIFGHCSGRVGVREERRERGS